MSELALTLTYWVLWTVIIAALFMPREVADRLNDGPFGRAFAALARAFARLGGRITRALTKRRRTGRHDGDKEWMHDGW